MVGRRTGRHYGGSIAYDDDTGVNIEVTTAGTPVILAISSGGSADSFGCTASATAGTITVPKGKYRVAFHASGTGEASDQMEAMVYIGSTATEVSGRHDFPASGMADVTLSGQGVVDVTAESALSVKLDSDTDADSLQVRSFGFTAYRIGPPG